MGVTLVLAALVAQAAPLPRGPSVITQVEVRLPPGADEKLLDRVTNLITVRRGQTLARRAIQRSIENLWATDRFSDVVVSVDEAGDDLAVIFELVPRRHVAEVYTEGRAALTQAEVLAAAKLEPGSEYWPERVLAAAERVAHAYRRKGFQEVRVEVRLDEGEAGTWVGFLIDEGKPTRITSVSMVGAPGLSLDRVLDTVGLRLGDVLDAARLDEGTDALRQLLRREAFYRARVERPALEAGGRVVLSVSAGPRYDVVFHGNRHLTDASLRAVLAYDGEEPLDEGLAQRLAARLARFYRFRGFHDVEVRPSERLGPDQRAGVLAFRIVEGLPLRVVQVTFEGNARIGTGELRGVLRDAVEQSAPQAPPEVHAVSDPLALEGRMSAVAGAELPSPPWETVFEEDSWTSAARAMTALYRSRGYLRASVQLAEVELRGQEARARFVVEEGPQARFRALRTTGLPEDFPAQAIPVLKVNEPFDPEALERARQELLRALATKGYLFAAASASYALDASGHFADPLLTVEAGPEVKVRAVLPRGNVRTRDEVLLRQSTVVEGAPLDRDALAKTQSNLVGLGAFRSVEVQMLAPERAEPLKTVLLKVRERPPLAGEFGLGYFYADGPRLAFDLDAPNLGGRGVNLNAHGQLNWVALSALAATGQVDVGELPPWAQLGGRGNLSIQSRSLLPANLGLRVDVGGERVFRPQFRFTRAALGPTIDWYTTMGSLGPEWLRPKLWVALQYEAEYSVVETSQTSAVLQSVTNRLDQERLRFRPGTFLLQTVRLSPALDMRDSALSPTKGLLLQASGEVTGHLYAAEQDGTPVEVNFLKVSGLASFYLPVARSFVLAFSARGGRIVALSPNSSTPPVKRFFLGGATSMRGFFEDQLVPEDVRSQYRQELRDCQVLVVKEGCTAASVTLGQGDTVPSQGGESFALLKAEARFPLYGSFELGLFFEAGNLWLSTPKSLGPFRTVAGGGLRYTTPIGPLALDLGVNLDPDLELNEPAYVVHFNIGVF